IEQRDEHIEQITHEVNILTEQLESTGNQTRLRLQNMAALGLEHMLRINDFNHNQAEQFTKRLQADKRERGTQKVSDRFEQTLPISIKTSGENGPMDLFVSHGQRHYIEGRRKPKLELEGHDVDARALRERN
ncbi:unnamed protein product, partial [Aphanomyces euteiches]